MSNHIQELRERLDFHTAERDRIRSKLAAEQARRAGVTVTQARRHPGPMGRSVVVDGFRLNRGNVAEVLYHYLDDPTRVGATMLHDVARWPLDQLELL